RFEHRVTQARPISIPFSRIEPNGTELRHIASAIERGDLAGGGQDAAACSRRLTELTGAADITLTPSGTHALELAALVLGLSPGDEIVMPSWTFVSTANAVVLRGATPVWADVTPG